MGKQTTSFARSRRFESVTFYEVGTVGGPPIVVYPSAAAPLAVPNDIGRAVIIPSLESFGVMLIQLAPNVEPGAILPLLKAYNDQGHAGRRLTAVAGSEPNGNPVYSAGSIDNLLVNQVVVQFRKGTDPKAIAALFKSFNAEVVTEPDDAGRDPYLVQFPGSSGHDARVISNRFDALNEVVYSQPNFVGIDPQRLSTGGQAGAALVCSVSHCPDPVSSVSSGDPFFVKQWHLDNPGTSGKPFADLNANKAWQITQGNPTIIIAVIDDLVEANHEDLLGKIVNPWNAFTQSSTASNLVLTNSDGHGTSVAGLAAAVTGNEIGVAGIAPAVKIMPVRTHNPTFPHYVIQRGIKHAADFADVLSMSWTLGWAELYPTGLPVIEDALQYAAIDQGRVLVFSAGNDQGQQPAYPASRTAAYPIIAVSATDAADEIKKIADPTDPCEWGSSNGPDTVAAPGVDLYTIDRTAAVGFCTSGSDDNYAKFSGTSAAAPLVAGTAALMLSADPSLTPLEIRTRLQQTAAHPNLAARPNDVSGWGLGWGRIDACRALQGTNCVRQIKPKPPTNVSVWALATAAFVIALGLWWWRRKITKKT